MEMGFAYDGLQGRVTVSCVPNDDPATLGTPEQARGFPACTATVAFPGRGYRALFGWVQLVRSTDNASGGAAFEADPVALFADSTAPHCWFGTTPTLFDAPWRWEKYLLDWLAHSFLVATPLAQALGEGRKLVIPLAGFAWGFAVDGRGGITLSPVEPLGADAWRGHVPYLRERYPGWLFPDSPDLQFGAVPGADAAAGDRQG
jgi:hypothetical protein